MNLSYHPIYTSWPREQGAHLLLLPAYDILRHGYPPENEPYYEPNLILRRGFLPENEPYYEPNLILRCGYLPE